MELSHHRAMTGAGAPASLIQLADTAITVAATVVAVGSLVLLFLSLGAEVVVRYLTTQGLGWPSEMPNILFPWLVMGGIVLAAQHGSHISVTLVLDLLGRSAARALLLGMQVVVAATFFYLAWIGMAVIEITGTEVYPVTGVSARWAYLSLIVGFAGVGLTALTTFARLLIAEDPMSVRAHVAEEEL
ncbi:TRAP transporter small permease [Azospirillum soli]|uniref:TRAP transporter small permease n=1 Tax=Azospirillum soli TaxID=1304799 RepID=UPI001AE27AC6|nr:TRAP transporter small permease [Azospirillum soli]MBP2315427.1 TRAP-type C4-dicarboxylate transport system permease small subunit [Azospirillum soli]